jgi:hypothetical protein
VCTTYIDVQFTKCVGRQLVVVTLKEATAECIPWKFTGTHITTSHPKWMISYAFFMVKSLYSSPTNRLTNNI